MVSRDFEDVNTEIDGLKDFSLPLDEGDATTTLLREKKTGQPATRGSEDKRPLPAPFDANSTEVSKPVRIADLYSDETVKMDRPVMPTSPSRNPKRS